MTTLTKTTDTADAKAVAKKAPAKTAPAKAAPKPAAKKAATTTTAPKIRWVAEGEKGGPRPATGTCEGRTYRIDGSGDSWSASVTIDGKTTVLVENAKASAPWPACVKHNREAQTPAGSAAA
jgi:hypothetical protein